MKTKNVILGLCAVLFAIGGAFASAFVTSQTIFVHAIKTQGGQVECVNTQESCDDNGLQQCSVQLNVTGPGSNITTNTFKDSQCAVPLGANISADPEMSEIAVYELQ